MKIFNIDAPDDIAIKVVSLRIPVFVIKVVQSLEREFYNPLSYEHMILRAPSPQNHTTFPLSPIWKLEEVGYGYTNIAAFIHTIPIYLRDSRPEIINDDNCIIVPLGAYYSNRRGNSPYIELYLTAINSSAKNKGSHFKWLLTTVLIHELAHAALDIFNYEHSPQSEKVSYHTEFGRWREESTANATALYIIREYGNKNFYDYARKFMQSQPPEYALGVLMEGNEGIQRFFYNVFFAKINGVNYTQRQQWLNYVKHAPDRDGLKMMERLLEG